MLNQLYTSNVSKFGQLRRGAADGDDARLKQLANTTLGPVIRAYPVSFWISIQAKPRYQYCL